MRLQFFETLYYCTVVHYNNFYIPVYSKTDFWANYIMSLWRKSKLHTGIYQRTICILVTSFVRHIPITSGTNPYCWPLLSCFRDTGPTESQWTSLTTERLGVWADTTSALSPGRQSFEKKYIISNIRQQQRLTASFYLKVCYSQTYFMLRLVQVLRLSSTSPLLQKFVFHCSHMW